MKLHRNLLFVLPLLVILSFLNIPACSYTPTHLPENTVTAAMTPTSSPTPYDEALMPVAGSGILLGEAYRVNEGGYEFKMISNLASPEEIYQLDVQGSQVTISSQDEGLLISLISNANTQSLSAGECLQQVLDGMGADVEEFQAEAAQVAYFGGTAGLKVDISGFMFEQPFMGRLAAAMPWEGGCFSAIGIALEGESTQRWQLEGEAVFETVMHSLSFFEPEVVLLCDPSDDASYAYSIDNPVRVGNTDLYDGLAREEAYLSVLTGPQGEKISYIRSGSTVNSAGDILDIYEITYPGLETAVTLYIDMYMFEPLKTPQGFICAAPFPIEEP